MKSLKLLVAVACWLLGNSFAWSQDTPGESPYFYLPTQEDITADFPLLHTDVAADIAGVIAHVRVTQYYTNRGSAPIEATYVFPAATRAAVHGLQMTIGSRIIQAEIREKKQARQQYEDAKKQGKSATLLEQHRPNVFQMNVANLLPGDTIKVELYYTELLQPEKGVYSFVYPTVVGPRYAGEPKEELLSAAKWVSNPYLPVGVVHPTTFELCVNLQSGIPIRDLRSLTHRIISNYQHERSVEVVMDDHAQTNGNRDFILDYRLQDDQIESGLLLYEGPDENFFLLMVEPPKRPNPTQLPTREYIFVVDVSGSMHGFPLATTKTLMNNLVGNLRPNDLFNVLLFAGSSRFLSPQSLPATRQNLNQAQQFLQQERGGGGTQILPALQQAMAVAPTPGVARSFVMITDGYVHVEAQAFDYIRSNLGKANFFTFGIGSSVNRHLIEGMAHVGNATSFVVTEPAEARTTAQRFHQYIQTPILTDLAVTYDGVEVYDLATPQVSDLLAERPILVFGKFRGKAQGKIRISGKNGKGSYQQTFRLQDAEKDTTSAALRYLWARHRIQLLGDYTQLSGPNNAPLVEEITQLGLRYNLLTPYTSFVAVDQLVRNPNGQFQTKKQPLPLPQGVPNTAVGNYAVGDEMEIEPPRTAEPPPPPPVIEEVPDEEIQEEQEPDFIDQSISENSAVAKPGSSMAVPPPPPPPPPKPAAETIFKIVETMPIFIGVGSPEQKLLSRQAGEQLLLNAIYREIQFPASVKAKGIAGMVVIQFIVDKYGNMTDFKIMRDIGEGCGAEVLRVLKLLQAEGNVWIPGKQRGRPVAVCFNLPIKIHVE